MQLAPELQCRPAARGTRGDSRVPGGDEETRLSPHVQTSGRARGRYHDGIPSAPTLQLGPELRQRAESCFFADKNGNALLEGVWVISGRSHVFYVSPVLLQNFPAVVEDDHAISGIIARSP